MGCSVESYEGSSLSCLPSKYGPGVSALSARPPIRLLPRCVRPALPSCLRPPRSKRVLVSAEDLATEVRSPELPRLRGRWPCIAERLHDLIGEIPLRGWKTRGIVPAQSSADVVMHPRLRASDLVGAPMQLPHLFQQCLEHVVMRRCSSRTCSSSVWNTSSSIATEGQPYWPLSDR